uniref:Uncharacterized protein n=1 Tax=Salix viminalis TaxID=40686 RepID=A0A6N2LM64_SALVM
MVARQFIRQRVLICLVVATSILMVAITEPIFKQKGSSYNETQKGEYPHHVTKGHSGYQHVWPQHVGGIGGGGIFVPMLTLIISGFDSKSSTTLSKCK